MHRIGSDWILLIRLNHRILLDHIKLDSIGLNHIKFDHFKLYNIELDRIALDHIKLDRIGLDHINFNELGCIIFGCFAEYDTIQYDFQLNTIKLWYNYNTIMMQSNPITIHYYDTTWIALLDHIGFLGLIIND